MGSGALWPYLAKNGRIELIFGRISCNLLILWIAGEADDPKRKKMAVLMALSFRYWGTAGYIIMIVMINLGVTTLPLYHIWDCDISPMDPIAGIIYLSRDFSQRELGHYVFIAMILGAGLSYSLASPAIAIASISAFAVGEMIDWSIFAFTRRPLRDRLLWSALISSPFDSAIFLFGIHRLNLLAVILMTLGKFMGVWVIWAIWLQRNKQKLFIQTDLLKARF